MCAFGDEDDRTVFTARIERRLDRQDTAQFAMRTRLGRHGNAVHAGKINQPMCQFVDHLQRTLHRFLRLQRMDVDKAFHTRHLFIEARVVLHRAATEREKAEVDGIILPRQAGVVADGFGL